MTSEEIQSLLAQMSPEEINEAIPGKMVVTMFDAYYKRRWECKVATHDRDVALRTAWNHWLRPSWCKFRSAVVEPYRPLRDQSFLDLCLEGLASFRRT